MTDLMQVKKDILCLVQNVKVVRGMGQGLLDHHVVLCKVRLVEPWIKRRKVVDGGRRIRSEKLRENQYRKGGKSFERMRVEWDGESI